MERLKRSPTLDHLYLDIDVHNSWKSLAKYSFPLQFILEDHQLINIEQINELKNIPKDPSIALIMNLRIKSKQYQKT